MGLRIKVLALENENDLNGVVYGNRMFESVPRVGEHVSMRETSQLLKVVRVTYYELDAASDGPVAQIDCVPGGSLR